MGMFAWLARWLGQMAAGSFPSALQVDLLDAARAVSAPTVETAVAAWRASLPVGDELAPYRLTLTGGDAVRGFDLARRQGHGSVEIGVNTAVSPSGARAASS